MVERVARHVGTVLIVGETGTEKQKTAQTIHEHSVRCRKPFVEINCAAVPENLVESELFGYEKGAFSGADTAKPDLFETANSGMIFLDEIGEFDLKVQVKLLRVLDRAPYYRLGGNGRSYRTSAWCRPPIATQRRSQIRPVPQRIYHRLSQFELCVPPVRERPEDITALATHFLTCESEEQSFTLEVLGELQTDAWPGNVRELQNLVKQLSVSVEGARIDELAVRDELRDADSDDVNLDAPLECPKAMDTLEADAIERALEQTGGHRRRAAAQLAISRRTMSRKLREYGLTSARRVTRAALGVLDQEQQRLFRAALRVPISIKTADEQELSCTTKNLSESGMGLEGLPANLGHNCRLRVRFAIRGFRTPLQAAARVAWVDAHGSAGITFTDMDAASQQQMKDWLCHKMLQERWTVQPPPQSPARHSHLG